MLYEGKSKKVWSVEEGGYVKLYFKDDATAFNGVKKEIFKNKGYLNCEISAFFMTYLKNKGIPVHFIMNMEEENCQLCHGVDIFPVEVVVRNIAAGSLTKRLGIESGTVLDKPLVEYFYKSDELNDPLISEGHIEYFNWASEVELMFMKRTSLHVNHIIKEFWKERGLALVDLKLEYGKTKGGDILLADEITPDSWRLWDLNSGKSMDKDVFRKDTGNLIDVYSELFAKIIE